MLIPWSDRLVNKTEHTFSTIPLIPGGYHRKKDKKSEQVFTLGKA
jgi:hypothetical protein